MDSKDHYWASEGDPLPLPAEEIANRLWPEIEMRPDGCWVPRTRLISPEGQTFLCINKQSDSLHHWVWRLMRGRREKRLACLCDTLGCCNPAHRTPYRGRPVKIREEDRQAIEAALASGVSQTEIAREYGVSQQAISHAFRYRSSLSSPA